MDDHQECAAESAVRRRRQGGIRVDPFSSEGELERLTHAAIPAEVGIIIGPQKDIFLRGCRHQR